MIAGESESSDSFSSHSERCSEEKMAMTESPTEDRQSSEVASKTDEELKESVKILTEKLSAALVNVSAKEDLVKQHAKVAEEAVAGWEKAENEVTLLKQQFDIALQQNLNLEVKSSHLDGALKECVRQLRQSRDELEKKAELEKQIIDLQTEVEIAKAENAALLEKLEGFEKENLYLKKEIISHCEDLETVTIERDLSTQAAEAASKLQLESIKKVAKLEAECRRLQSMARKLSPQKSVGSEPLILEIDRVKNKNPISSNLSVEIDMMDDFLEMERLAALDEMKTDAPIAEDDTPLTVELDLMSKRVIELEEKLEKLEAEKSELRKALDESLESLKAAGIKLEEVQKEIDAVNKTREILQFQIVGMEAEARAMSENVDELKLEVEEERMVSRGLNSKCRELENELSRTIQEREMKINELNSEIEEEKRVSAELKSKCLELEDELVSGELKSRCRELEDELSRTIQECEKKINELNSEIKEERRVSAELKSKCLELEDELTRLFEETDLRQNANSNGEVKVKQEDLAVAADKLTECQKTIASLGRQLQSLATLEDFLIDTSNIPGLSRGSQENIWRLSSNEAIVPNDDSEFSRMSMEKYTNIRNGNEDSLPSSSTNHISAVRPRNSFGNSFF